MALEVLAHLEAAWNAGDGTAFGDRYTADASFVTVRGEHILGREAIGAGHAGIFSTIYAGSVNRMELVRATRDRRRRRPGHLRQHARLPVRPAGGSAPGDVDQRRRPVGVSWRPPGSSSRPTTRW